MDVREQVPIKIILDRGYPDYNYPAPLTDPHQLNYRKFISSFVERGGKIERFVPGSSNQVVLRHSAPGAYPNFSIRNLAVNGKVWTGISSETTETFPPLDTLAKADYPTENKCSLALRLAYEGFRYFSAGDMDHDVGYGRMPWGDIESEVARASGPVDVAMANHHGYANACGPQWVSSLRPRVIVISAWDSAHPTIPSLENMLSQQLDQGHRDIYSTALKAENVIATKRLHEIQSGNGHVVVRVSPSQNAFETVVTTNHDESDRVLARFGPYKTSVRGG